MPARETRFGVVVYCIYSPLAILPILPILLTFVIHKTLLLPKINNCLGIYATILEPRYYKLLLLQPFWRSYVRTPCSLHQR